MAILPLATLPKDEKILRQRCKPVVGITDRTKRLIEDMIDTMYDAAGVGLAAPQVHVAQRIFVYDVGEGPEALINPEIILFEGEEIGPEACLSIPRWHGDVARATHLVVSGLNRRGRRVQVDATDYLARVFQHEIDHLNGVLFTDKVVPKSLYEITEEEEAERRAQGRKRRRGRAAAEPVPEEPVA